MTAVSLQIETPRLRLRAWKPEDYPAFSRMNADASVMRFFPALMSEEESIAAAVRYNAQLERDGFTMFALESRNSHEFLGVLGAQTMRFEIPGVAQPTVEIGWRLTAKAQGQGYATEGARAVLQHLRESTRLREVVAITAPVNEPSQNVMRKLGMSLRPELSFEHPRVPESSPLRRHVLYTLELQP